VTRESLAIPCLVSVGIRNSSLADCKQFQACWLNRKLPVVCRRESPKDESHPQRHFIRQSDNLMLPPLDLQSWILVIPLVSHVSECSTIRTALALPRGDDNGAETSMRLGKKGKAGSRRNLGIVLARYSRFGKSPLSMTLGISPFPAIARLFDGMFQFFHRRCLVSGATDRFFSPRRERIAS
jgi:hypothetical protein